jgi:hypothetical protein
MLHPIASLAAPELSPVNGEFPATAFLLHHQLKQFRAFIAGDRAPIAWQVEHRNALATPCALNQRSAGTSDPNGTVKSHKAPPT